MKNIFIDDLNFTVSTISIPIQQPSENNNNNNNQTNFVALEDQSGQTGKKGFENFTAAKYKEYTDSDSDSNHDSEKKPDHFHSVVTPEGYAFSLASSEAETKSAIDDLLQDKYIEFKPELELPEIITCRVSKAKEGYSVSGYSTTGKVWIFAYTPKTKEFTDIYIPTSKNINLIKETNDAIHFGKNLNLDPGTHIFVVSNDFSSTLDNQREELKQAFSKVDKIDSTEACLGKIAEITKNNSFVVAAKLPSKKAYPAFNKKVLEITNEQNIDVLVLNDIKTLGLQATLTQIAKSPSKYKYTENTVQQYVNSVIQKDDNATELKDIAKHSNIHVLSDALIRCAQNPNQSVSKEKLNQAQTVFYETAYAEQVKNRFWRKVGAVITSILLAPTIIVPIAIYAWWRYKKNHEDIQMREISIIPVVKETKGMDSSEITTALIEERNTNSANTITNINSVESKSEAPIEKPFLNIKNSLPHLRKLSFLSEEKKDMTTVTVLMRQGAQTEKFDAKHETNQSCFGCVR